ncbi:hypothetical protein SK803_01730 [Lentzea sp. BCCO 10_0856]|uniref:Uncharacterized protein n=1 Tax=Lentzea miocenica TaxID=3095431 RepID=A0ABU4SSM8_9PSEU|nr:hypothetical protein [Lentzea sp. BCCO 10_0856]MDX8028906.1 hypothetical protein [Lentzea sp. BCCO 10_0856]
MRTSGRPRHGAGALVAALVTGLVVVAPGTANAAQQPNWAMPLPVKWSTTDSKRPHEEITTGDQRVGAWRDDKHHIGKSYLTFDITRFKGTQLFTANLRTPEKAANDCTKPRSTQMWVVRPQNKITWADQPAEIANVAPNPVPDQDCVSQAVTWNVVEPVKQALEKGQTTITFALRIAEQFQGEVEYGRTYDPTGRLNATFNTPPGTPTDLKIDIHTCNGTTTPVIPSLTPRVKATLHDADPDNGGVSGRVAFWPVHAPEQRIEVVAPWAPGSIDTLFPAGLVQDGGTYAFAVRTEDGFTNSEWSAPCRFTADITAPATPPMISSATFRENGGPPGDGGEGMPGDFTFSANGVTDVVAFEYDGLGIPSGRVAADAPGGKATITITPTTDGPVSIQARSLDRAGLRSETRTYRYWVRTTGPWVQLPQFELGTPGEVVFNANQDGATRFVYQLDGGQEQSVPVGDDRKGRHTFLFTVPGSEYHALKVWTVDDAGTKSGVHDTNFYVDQLRPWVDVDPWDGIVGQKRTITVSPSRDGVVSYVYKIGDDPEKVLPAAADGSLTFEYTPTTKGYHDVLVASVNAAGVRSGWGDGTVVAEAPAPTVTSNDYKYEPQGAPGQAGTFTFSSPRIPVVSYEYRFNGDPWQATTGTQIQWAPKKPGYHYLYVRGVTESGFETDEQSYMFQVKPLPPTVTSPQFPDGGPVTARPNQPVEFVVTPALPGSHEVLWSISFGAPTVVPVGEDGKARFTYTPGGSFELTVSSRTPDGIVSGDVKRTYSVPTS